jgi:hypothetical protein
MNSKDWSGGQLVAETVDQLKQCVKSNKTEHVRAAAYCVAELRRRSVIHRTGLPGWNGRARSYRDFIGDIYDVVDLQGLARSNMQSRLTYHVKGVVHMKCSGRRVA